MTVQTANECITKIIKLCDEIALFNNNHAELTSETGFLVDVVDQLCNYKNLLKKEINKAELRI